MVVNYGLNKVRFTAPVPVGSRLRAAGHVVHGQQPEGGAVQLTVEVAIEAEGAAKPVCIAESLARHYR
jgi:acyl dehydratase